MLRIKSFSIQIFPHTLAMDSKVGYNKHTGNVWHATTNFYWLSLQQKSAHSHTHAHICVLYAYESCDSEVCQKLCLTSAVSVRALLIGATECSYSALSAKQFLTVFSSILFLIVFETPWLWAVQTLHRFQMSLAKYSTQSHMQTSKQGCTYVQTLIYGYVYMCV